MKMVIVNVLVHEDKVSIHHRRETKRHVVSTKETPKLEGLKLPPAPSLTYYRSRIWGLWEDCVILDIAPLLSVISLMPMVFGTHSIYNGGVNSLYIFTHIYWSHWWYSADKNSILQARLKRHFMDAKSPFPPWDSRHGRQIRLYEEKSSLKLSISPTTLWCIWCCVCSHIKSVLV